MRSRHVVVCEAPDAAVVVAVGQPVLLLQIAWDGRVVLDDLAIIIGYPYTAIRADGEVDRVEPNVSRDEEFRFRLLRRAPDFEERAVAAQEGAVDELEAELAALKAKATAPAGGPGPGAGA